MKNFKVTVDRPQLESSEINAQQNFNELLNGHKVMSKPFYKSSWFFGTAGLASLSLIVGSVLSFKLEPDDQLEKESLFITDAPPDEIKVIPIAQNSSLKFTVKYKDAILSQVETKKELDDNIITLNPSNPENPEEVKGSTETSSGLQEKNDSAEPQLTQEKVTKKSFDMMDLHPRIANHINGNITKKELLDENGLVTAADVVIIYFELHIIDAGGGKVFKQEGNLLTDEMKEAIDNLTSGQTIYFEGIKGQDGLGNIVRLNPLRYYVLG